jgi:hypothetical protein
MIPQSPTETTTYVEETFRLLNAPAPWVMALVVLPASVAFAWWAYTGMTRLERPTRITLSALRWLAIVLCCVLLFEPAYETTTYRRTRNQVHVLVDDSASMARKDGYPNPAQQQALASLVPGAIGERTRSDLAATVLERDDGLLASLAKTHDVRLFRVQQKPLPIRGLGELTARGNRTSLGDALDVHLAAVDGANVDAVVLVSDGRNNTGLDPTEVARDYALRGIALYTIGVGDPEPPRNGWLVGPPGPKEALREEQVGFDVTLRAAGLAGQRARVELHGSRDGGAERLLTTAQDVLPADGQATRVRLTHAFDEAGDWTLRFRLAPSPDETQLDDNEDVRFLRVEDERIRVLFIDDRPRWEYRYVKNGLKRVDPSIHMQAVLFDASPRFAQEHSKDLPPLRDIPRTEKELLQYHAILLGDVPPERIAPDEEGRRQWLNLLLRFVEFGGGVGFLFGDAAMPERYRNTIVQDLLPVVLEDPSWLAANPPSRTQEFRPLLENPLQPHEILMLQRDPAFNRRLWEQGLPGFYVYHPVQRPKPGATVLLRHPTDGNAYGKRPIAVVAPFPRGTTFFLGTDETWRWRDPYAERYMDAFWRNVVRHLARGRLERRNDLVELTVDKTTIDTGDRVRVLVRAHDAELQPAAADEQPVFLRDQRGAVERRNLRPVPGEPGVYEGSFTMAETGAFSFLVFANHNPDDRVLAREDVLVRIPDAEMADSSQDPETLRRIAENSRGADTSGRYVFLADAASLAPEFAKRKSFETQEDKRTTPVWDSVWSLLAMLAVLAAEWLLRKRCRLI